jgi:C1A family cysteine protease
MLSSNKNNKLFNNKFAINITRIHKDELKFHEKPTLLKLPLSVDLRPKMTPVFDQKELGSCTANALVACYEYLHPIVVGIQVYESFESLEVAKTGQVPMPSSIPHKNDKCLGGHAVCIVGYDDAHASFIMRNSWGASWGDKGYFYLPYAYILDQTLTSDLWVLTK